MPVQEQKGDRGIAPPIYNLGARRRRCEQHNAPAALPLCKNSVPIVKKAERASELVWTYLQPGFDPRAVKTIKSRHTNYTMLDACSLGNKTLVAHRSIHDEVVRAKINSCPKGVRLL